MVGRPWAGGESARSPEAGAELPVGPRAGGESAGGPEAGAGVPVGPRADGESAGVPEAGAELPVGPGFADDPVVVSDFGACCARAASEPAGVWLDPAGSFPDAPACGPGATPLGSEVAREPCARGAGAEPPEPSEPPGPPEPGPPRVAEAPLDPADPPGPGAAAASPGVTRVANRLAAHSALAAPAKRLGGLDGRRPAGCEGPRWSKTVPTTRRRVNGPKTPLNGGYLATAASSPPRENLERRYVDGRGSVGAVSDLKPSAGRCIAGTAQSREPVRNFQSRPFAYAGSAGLRREPYSGFASGS